MKIFTKNLLFLFVLFCISNFSLKSMNISMDTPCVLVDKVIDSNDIIGTLHNLNNISLVSKNLKEIVFEGVSQIINIRLGNYDNENGQQTILHQAVLNNDLLSVALICFLSIKNPEIKNYFSQKNPRDFTPLDLAVGNKFFDITKFLLSFDFYKRPENIQSLNNAFLILLRITENLLLSDYSKDILNNYLEVIKFFLNNYFNFINFDLKDIFEQEFKVLNRAKRICNIDIFRAFLVDGKILLPKYFLQKLLITSPSNYGFLELQNIIDEIDKIIKRSLE